VPLSSGQIMQSSAGPQWKSETMQIAGAGPVPEFGMRFIRGRVSPARIRAPEHEGEGERDIFKSAARRLELESAASRVGHVSAHRRSLEGARRPRARALGRKYSNLDRAPLSRDRARARGDRRDVILHK